MWKKVLLLALPFLALVGSAILFTSVQYVNRTGITVINTVMEPELDASVSVDSGLENVRPTAEKLADEFLIWEIRELAQQAKTPEDKKLIQDALNIKLQRIRALGLSPDFETNMKRGLK